MLCVHVDPKFMDKFIPLIEWALCWIETWSNLERSLCLMEKRTPAGTLIRCVYIQGRCFYSWIYANNCKLLCCLYPSGRPSACDSGIASCSHSPSIGAEVPRRVCGEGVCAVGWRQWRPSPGATTLLPRWCQLHPSILPTWNVNHLYV